jgi:DNA-binding transcriptional MerR regulator
VNKAPEAFRTISEVAQELDVPQHVLRFWESRFQQIRPMKRGGGRRYYRPDDVDLLRGIRHLLYGEGYTIRGVQRILRDQGIKIVQGVWQAGAEQPHSQPGDDDGGDDEAPVASGRRADLDHPAATAASAEGEVRPRAGTDALLLEDEDRRKLADVLDGLVECRRLIEAALVEGPADV